MSSPVQWEARTKDELAIEVWEALDCESVGERELAAIETEVRKRFGDQAVEMPMKIARLLADEGAVLRHPEVIEFDVRRRAEALESPVPRLDFRDFEKARKQLIGLARRLASLLEARRDLDAEKIRRSVIEGRDEALEGSGDEWLSDKERAMRAEIAEWITHWLHSPTIFENWVKLRTSSEEFRSRFIESD